MGRARYAARSSLVRRVHQTEDAEVILFAPNYTERNRAFDQAVDLARASGKPLFVFAAGDAEPIVAWAGAVLFHAGLHRHQGHPGPKFAVPAFIEDPVVAHLDGEFAPLAKTRKPIVGFCGQAAISSRVKHAKYGWSLLVSQGASIGRRHRTVPPPLRGHLRLRRMMLGAVSASDQVETNFIIRGSYRAGLGHDPAKASHDTTAEFHQNIANSHYTLCVRGGGNFSVRLYETLAHGRIPLILNTDLRLPFDFSINWSDFAVIVDDPRDTAEAVLRHFEAHSGSDFERLQHRCREFWLERLSKDGYWKHFREHLGFVASATQRSL
jgi:hypothetical protein